MILDDVLGLIDSGKAEFRKATKQHSQFLIGD